MDWVHVVEVLITTAGTVLSALFANRARVQAAVSKAHAQRAEDYASPDSRA